MSCISVAACFNVATINKTFYDCFSIDSQGSGWRLVAVSSGVHVRCFSFSSSKSTGTALYAGFYCASAFNSVFNDCVAQCNRTTGILFNTCINIVFSNYQTGTAGINQKDIDINNDTFNTVLFSDSVFGSATFVNNYLNMLPGSKLSFHNLNQTANNHAWYTDTGIARSTGVGLADANIRTAGSLALRFAPESLTGLFYEFKILAKANSGVSVYGFIQKNAAFGVDVVTCDLYLPGSTSPDATMNMPNDTNWNLFTLAANYTGAVDAYAKVRITAKSVAAGAYAYLDDVYNGTNKIIALDVWDEGQPSPIMFEQLGDSAAVWNVLTSTMTTAGSSGEMLINIDTTGTSNASILSRLGGIAKMILVKVLKIK